MVVFFPGAFAIQVTTHIASIPIKILHFLETFLARIFIQLQLYLNAYTDALTVSYASTVTVPPVLNKQVPQVSGLLIYPVKSLRAVSLQVTTLDALGLVGDRRFMLVVPALPPPYGFLPNDATLKFITQLQCPTMATINAKINSDNTLTLSCDSSQEISSITLPLSTMKNNPIFNARIWSDTIKVQDMGNQVAEFVQHLLPSMDGVRLVTMAGPRYATKEDIPPEARTWRGDTPQTSLNYGFPILIAFEASLQEVNRRLKAKGKQEIPMSRFRANIVITNTQPFEEDQWKIIQIGNVTLHLVKGCGRCKQSCMDQRTGILSDEPLTTLSEFRTFGDEVYFAQNAVAQRGTFMAVGDTVKVLMRGNPIWD